MLIQIRANQNMCCSNKIFSLICSLVFIPFVSCSPVLNKTSLTPPLLLLISFDGFRWDYPDIYQLPTFNSLIRRGVHVKHIENSFVTATFPSHFTMVTGLYEESHGIVANTMYDVQLNATAAFTNLNDSRWWSQNPSTQPIWVSNQLSNDSVLRRSGVIAWPGGDVPVNGHRPTRYVVFNSTSDCGSSLRLILDWFRDPPETRINFGAVYCNQPDNIGHTHGPMSDEMNRTVHQCDRDVKELLHIIDGDEYLRTNLNVILTSDHGMYEVKKNQRIKLVDYIDSSLYRAYGTRTYLNVFVPAKDNIDRIYRNLTSIAHLEVYKKSDIPDEYHYKSNVRIGDILLVTKVGWEIIVPDDDMSYEYLGNHGHDNRDPSMHPIFYAFGPLFRINVEAEPFRSVDYYPLMSYILQLQPRETNGSLDKVKSILKDFSDDNLFQSINSLVSKTTAKVTNWGYLTMGCLFAVVVLAVCFTSVACRHSKQLIYVQAQYPPVRYRLLSVNEGSTNNFIDSESDEEIN